jgi:hypothetical protein
VGFTDRGAGGNERGELKMTQGLKNNMPDPLSDFTQPDIKWACGHRAQGTLSL